MKKTADKVFIVGDSALVEECAAIFRSAGYGVSVRYNDSPVRKRAGVPRSTKLVVELSTIDLSIKRTNLLGIERNVPRTTLILSSSVTVSATEQASWLKYPDRLVGVSALPSLFTERLVEIAPTIRTSPGIISEAKEVLSRLGKECAVVQDRVGMVLPRILCMLMNEAAFNAMEGTASPQDIDTAMKLGTNYPFGPIEWAGRIGIGNVVAVLDALYRDLHEERYRVCPLLRQLSLGKQWW